jgi:hypothetical protein
MSRRKICWWLLGLAWLGSSVVFLDARLDGIIFSEAPKPDQDLAAVLLMLFSFAVLLPVGECCLLRERVDHLEKEVRGLREQHAQRCGQHKNGDQS